MQPFQIDEDGIRLAVRLTPRARHDRIDGVAVAPDGKAALTIRLAAAPIEGAANRALIAFLTKELGLAKSRISIEAGETARVKRLFLETRDPVVIERLSALADRGAASQSAGKRSATIA